MDFEPKTEKEIEEGNLLKEGDYNFDILQASDEVSKQGNAMIKVKLGLYVDGEVKNRIFDYLLPGMEAKLRHFCDTTGLLREYEQGTLTGDICSGRSGKCKIVIQKSDDYGTKNIIKDYICRQAKPLSSVSNDDDVPF